MDVLQEGKPVFSEGIDERGGWSKGASGPVQTISESRQTEIDSGQWMQTTKLHSLEVNPPLTDKDLRRPE